MRGFALLTIIVSTVSANSKIVDLMFQCSKANVVNTGVISGRT